MDLSGRTVADEEYSVPEVEGGDACMPSSPAEEQRLERQEQEEEESPQEEKKRRTGAGGEAAGGEEEGDATEQIVRYHTHAL